MIHESRFSGVNVEQMPVLYIMHIYTKRTLRKTNTEKSAVAAYNTSCTTPNF